MIAATASGLTGLVVGPTTPFNYPWRLAEPTSMSHQRLARLCGAQPGGQGLDRLRSVKTNSAINLWFNWAMIGVNLAFAALHIVQTQLGLRPRKI